MKSEQLRGIMVFLFRFRFRMLRKLTIFRDSILFLRIWERKMETLVTASLFFILSFFINILIMMGFENADFGESFWFTMVTVSTVGYGDMYPQSFWGRLFVIYFILVGITTFTIVIGELVNLGNRRSEQRRKGMEAFRGRKHIIAICPEGSDSQFIGGVCNGLKERMKDELVLVIVSPVWQELPSELSDFGAHFIFGSLESSSTYEEKANIHGAASLFVFPGSAGDLYTANLGQNLKRLNYRVRRIAFATKRSRFLDAYDEIIVPAEVSSALAAESIVGYGGRIVDDLLHPETGSSILSVPASLFANMTYGYMRTFFLGLEETVTVLGYTRSGMVSNNPRSETVLRESDSLNLIVEKGFEWVKCQTEIEKLMKKKAKGATHE